MSQQAIPTQNELKVRQYGNLLGVDFRADKTEVGVHRSPDMLNMISDIGGNPIKRYGYRKVGDAYDALVTSNSISYGVRQDLTGVVVVPISINQTTGMIEEDASKAITVPSSTHDMGEIVKAYGYQKFVIIMCKKGCIKVDVTKYALSVPYEITGTGSGMMSVGNLGETAPVCESIVPISTIGLKPDASNGVLYYGKNVMSIYQTYLYAGDGTSTEYVIPLYGKMGTWTKVEVMDSNGNWVTKTAGTDYTIGTEETISSSSLDHSSVVATKVVDAKITFTTAPQEPSTTLAGEDNVRITVAPFNNIDDTTIVIEGVSTVVKKGYYNETFDKMLNSDAQYFYEQRLFLAVGERSYYSEVSNPFNLPDNFYFETENDVMCYQRVSGFLVIITKDVGDNTVFLASAETVTDSNTGTTSVQFSVKASNAGVGAISADVGGVLNDEPIFLSSTGLYGIQTNYNSEKYAVNRSGRINRRLCKESNLSSAVGKPFNGYYYLCVNSRMYVLDSRHRDTTQSGETSYECYFFNNMPTVKDIFVSEGRMYFTDNTSTYTWNDKLGESLAYYDNLVLDNSGAFVSGTPVSAYWTSVFDDDGYPNMYKTLNKKGTLVSLIPHHETGCSLQITKNDNDIKQLDFETSIIFSFEQVSFGAEPYIRFKSNAVASDRFTKKKIKKYRRLQIKVINDRPQPFGLVSVTKTYEYGNYAKR